MMWQDICKAVKPCPCICHKPDSSYSPPGYHSRCASLPDDSERPRESPLCTWGCTGQVWLLPGLQRECRCVCHTVVNKIGWHGIQCLTGCSRWLPVEPHLETLLEALMRLEPPLHLEVRPSAGSYAWLGDVAKHTPEGLEGVACEGADTPLEAGVRAAHKALGLKENNAADRE